MPRILDLKGLVRPSLGDQSPRTLLVDADTPGSWTVSGRSFYNRIVVAKRPQFLRSSPACFGYWHWMPPHTPRFVAGKAGQALMVEEGTTNLLTANQASAEQGTTGFFSEGSATLTQDSSTRVFGSYSLCVTTPGNAIHEGVSTFSAPISGSFSSGQSFALSLYIKGSGTIEIFLWDKTNGANIGNRVQVSLTSNWQRVTAGGALSASSTSIVVYVWTPAVQAITFWIDGLQVEQKPYATSWIDGGATRAAEILTAPLAALSPAQGTVEWFGYTPNWSQYAPWYWRRLFGTSDNDGAGVYTIHYDPTDAKIRAHINNGSTIYDAATATLPAAGYHAYAMVWDSSGLYFYIDGALAASVAGPLTLPSSFAGPAIGIMGRTDGLAGVNDVPTGALADAMRFSSRARTASEISAVASAYLNNGTPPPVDLWTTYLLRFDGSLALW